MFEEIFESARRVFQVEAKAIHDLAGSLDHDFCKAVCAIIDTPGRVVVCGMGKSGIVARKIAATLSNTGTPSFFVHPGEAFHGDLGMVMPDDIFVAISYSGETEEVQRLIPFISDNKNYLVAITGNAASSLARASDAQLNIEVEREACPLQLAPTASTTAALAMGDALAVALMEARNFQPENFARFHPGGALGRQLTSRVSDEMFRNDIPMVSEDCCAAEVIHSMTKGTLGLTVVSAQGGYGIITDGDLRRSMEFYGADIFKKCAKDFMSAFPTFIEAGARIKEALSLMEARQISALLVLDRDKLVGIFKR